MFRTRRLNRLARKIGNLENEKGFHYRDFKTADARNDIEETVEAWRRLTNCCRMLSKLKKTQRKIEVKL